MRSSNVCSALLAGAMGLAIASGSDAAAQSSVPAAEAEETDAAAAPAPAPQPRSGLPFVQPPEVASQNGELKTTLTVMPAQQVIAGKTVTFPALYNGLYTPPVLRVQPGDTVSLLLNNFARLPTNLHYHGFNVTPRGRGDNIYISVDQGDSWQYRFRIPASHPQGLYWYHPHRDPLLNTQIAGGMAGGIIVGDILAPFPSLQGIPERLMFLKDLKTTEDGFPVEDPDPSGPTLRTINGLFQPKLEMRPGQLEFWRIGNQSSNIFYRLRLGGQRFYVIAQDGNLQNWATETQTLLLPPGGRREVLIYGPPAGTYRMLARPFTTGPAGDRYPGQAMMTVVSSGTPVPKIPIPSGADFPKKPDLRKVPVDQQRTIVFSDTADPNLFYINGKPYTPDCIDTVVNLGEVEEWTILNTAQEAHVFHIHQLDFQVTEVNGQPKPFTGYNDVVTLPAAPSDTEPSIVKLLIPFTNPVIVGKFVYHCHIIQHEDQGMMANILVVDPKAPPPGIRRCQTVP